MSQSNSDAESDKNSSPWPGKKKPPKKHKQQKGKNPSSGKDYNQEYRYNIDLMKNDSNYFLTNDTEARALKYIFPDKQKLKYRKRHQIALEISRNLKYPLKLFNIQNEKGNKGKEASVGVEQKNDNPFRI